MDQEEFSQKYVGVLRRQPFALYPLPDLLHAPLNVAQSWQTKKFEYVEHNEAYVVIRDISSTQHYNIALALVEFAIPGIMRLTRQLQRTNGDLL